MMRRMGISGSVASVVIVMIGARAALAQAQTKPSHKPAALVNGEPIQMEEIDAVLKHEPPTPNAPSEIQRRQMQLEALSLVIDDRLVQQFLRKNGPAGASIENAPMTSLSCQDCSGWIRLWQSMQLRSRATDG